MENRRNTRKIRQTRAFNTKENILEAAYKLFCEKGYYKTNSIEISKTAGVSIGCFYSYFKDKDAVFFEILDLYNKNFLEASNNIEGMLDTYKDDKQQLLFQVINKLIEAHEASKDLNKELSLMCNSNAAVASIMDEQHKKIRQTIVKYLHFYESDIKVTDIDAAAIIMDDIIDSIVERVVFKKNDLDSLRIIKAGVEAINKYLFK